MNRMTRLIYIAVIHALLLVAPQWTLGLEQHYKHEAHTIMKRMAEVNQGFEGHDVARVHLVEGQGRRKKRFAKRGLKSLNEIHNLGGENALELELSSGSTIKLDLKRAGIVDPETIVSYHTEGERVQRKRGTVDCYFHGEFGDSSGKGWAAVSHCDGLFGFANSPGYEYYLHPVEIRRSRRDTEEDYDVHVMWRRSEPRSSDYNSNDKNDTLPIDADNENPNRMRRNAEDRSKIVIEMAMFSDKEYWDQIHKLYPGREDDFLLTRLAGSQSLFNDTDKVGYEFQIKLKFMEYWITNPDDYTFTQLLGPNLKYGCMHTTSKYSSYDVHAINTGITAWNNGLVGLAYMSGTCTPGQRCFVLRGNTLDTFVGFSHELGHTLGMNHFDTCPTDLKTEGGFMGGGNRLNFSPCMKSQLDKFIDTGKRDCIFSETHPVTTPEEYNNLPSLLAGQVLSPDGLCHLIAGPGYKYVPNERKGVNVVCQLLVCQNRVESDPEYGRVERGSVPLGFTCDEESYCESDGSCNSWQTSNSLPFTVKDLEKIMQIPQWTQWSTLSSCSRSCGTGVRTRSRDCRYPGFNLSPYCVGNGVEAELCNPDPCPGDPTSNMELRHLRGHEVCARFLENHVELHLKGAIGYIQNCTSLKISDIGAQLPLFPSKSCLLKCKRLSTSGKGDLDAFFPDGSFCTERRRPLYEESIFNITSRCLRGQCHEFTDCPLRTQNKDLCGICDGDGSRCVIKTFDINDDVPSRQRKVLDVVPPYASNIDVYMDMKKNPGLIFELWNNFGQKIIGPGGLYAKKVYEGSEAVPYAGTFWSYNPSTSYLRASSSINETVVIKVLRRANPIRKIFLKYAKAA